MCIRNNIKYPHVLMKNDNVDEFKEFIDSNDLELRVGAGYIFVQTGEEPVVYQPDVFQDGTMTFKRLNYVPDVPVL